MNPGPTQDVHDALDGDMSADADLMDQEEDEEGEEDEDEETQEDGEAGEDEEYQSLEGDEDHVMQEGAGGEEDTDSGLVQMMGDSTGSSSGSESQGGSQDGSDWEEASAQVSWMWAGRRHQGRGGWCDGCRRGPCSMLSVVSGSLGKE